MNLELVLKEEINNKNYNSFISFLQDKQIINGTFEGNHYNFYKLTSNTVICYNGIGHEFLNYDVSESIIAISADKLIKELEEAIKIDD